MKVILLKDVKKQGKAGEIKEFADGYATFLIKSGNATLLTKGSMDKLNKQIKSQRELEKQMIDEATVQKDKIEKLSIKIPVKTGKMDKMFGSISTKQISSSLSKLGFDIDKRKISLDHDITSLGTHIVKLNLHKKVVADLKIEVVKE